MGLPIARSQTFVDGDVITAAFLNTWVQDLMIGIRADLDGDIQDLVDHMADSTDPHGAVQTVTTKYVAPLFESSSPSEIRYLDVGAFHPDDGFAANMAYTAQGDLYSTGADATARDAYGPVPARPADVLTRLDLTVDRTGAGTGTVELVIRERSGGFGGTTAIITLTANAGVDVQTVTWTGTYTLRSDRSYQAKLTVANNASSGDIKVHLIKFTFNRTKR